MRKLSKCLGEEGGLCLEEMTCMYEEGGMLVSEIQWEDEEGFLTCKQSPAPISSIILLIYF